MCQMKHFGKGVPVESNRGTQYKDHNHRYGYETIAWNVAVADDSLIVQNEHYMLRKLNTHIHTLQLYYSQDTKYTRTLDVHSTETEKFNMESHLIQNKQNENNKPYTNTGCRYYFVSLHLQMIWYIEVDRFMVAADEEINRLKCLRSLFLFFSSPLTLTVNLGCWVEIACKRMNEWTNEQTLQIGFV